MFIDFRGTKQGTKKFTFDPKLTIKWANEV